MKFELVGFYPMSEAARNEKNKNKVGTIHVYIVDYKIDIRGINVQKTKKSLFFNMPRSSEWCDEANERVRFPVFRLTDEKEHEELIAFLNKEAKPLVMEALKTSKSTIKRTHPYQAALKR